MIQRLKRWWELRRPSCLKVRMKTKNGSHTIEVKGESVLGISISPEQDVEKLTIFGDTECERKSPVRYRGTIEFMTTEENFIQKHWGT